MKIPYFRQKGLGVGLMVSVFLSCAFGFGMEIVEKDLVKVNQSRLNKVYTDKEAVIHLFESNIMRPLIGGPFVRYLNGGPKKDG